jgi:hypothetical protein
MFNLLEAGRNFEDDLSEAGIDYLFPDIIDSSYVRAGISDSVSEMFLYAQAGDARLRNRVAENPNLPAFIAAILVGDPNPDVRITLSENSNISYETAFALCRDASADVRYAVAANGRMPASILCELAGDENPFVCQRAQQTIRRLNAGEKRVIRVRRDTREDLQTIFKNYGWQDAFTA